MGKSFHDLVKIKIFVNLLFSAISILYSVTRDKQQISQIFSQKLRNF